MTVPHSPSRLLAALIAASAATGLRLDAQITEISRRPIADIAHLTFGSLCDDRFVIRNDGPNPVTVEYAVEKGTEHTPLTLDGREQVELESKSKDALELWHDGKLVAKAEKEGRKCKDLAGNASIAIAPLEVQGNPRDNDNTRRNGMGMGVGLGYGYPFFDPWFSPFGAYGWGYRPFYAGFYGVPIVIGGGRGGRRR